jgi:hypothetical protein
MGLGRRVALIGALLTLKTEASTATACNPGTFINATHAVPALEHACSGGVGAIEDETKADNFARGEVTGASEAEKDEACAAFCVSDFTDDSCAYWMRTVPTNGDSSTCFTYTGGNLVTDGEAETSIEHNATWIRSHRAGFPCDGSRRLVDTTSSLLANNNGSSYYFADFWNVACKIIPAETGYISVTMGEVVDFFKPIAGATFCEMLVSGGPNSKHQFWNPNPMNGVPGWVVPVPFVSDTTFGGSTLGWPILNVKQDSRKYLSFWGRGTRLSRKTGNRGGCCSKACLRASLGIMMNRVRPRCMP